MSVTATATLTTTGSITAPRKGDVLDYRVTIGGDVDTITVTPSPITYQPSVGNPVTLTPVGGPWTFVIQDVESIPAPTVVGPLSQSFTQDPADPHHYSAVI